MICVSSQVAADEDAVRNRKGGYTGSLGLLTIDSGTQSLGYQALCLKKVGFFHRG